VRVGKKPKNKGTNLGTRRPSIGHGVSDGKLWSLPQKREAEKRKKWGTECDFGVRKRALTGRTFIRNKGEGRRHWPTVKSEGLFSPR